MPQLGIVAIIQLVATVGSIAYSVVSGLKARKAAKRAKREAEERAARRNYRASVPQRRIIYGRRNIGGPFLYLDNPSTDVLLAFVQLASHEIDAIEQIFLNEEYLYVPPGGGIAYNYERFTIFRGTILSPTAQREVTRTEWESYPTSGVFTAFGESWDGSTPWLGSKFDNRMEIYPFLGAPGQDVGAKLLELGATNIQSSDKFEGIAGLVIKTNKLSKEIPDVAPNWNALVRGKKVLRKDGSTAWSANVAECGRDFLEDYVPSPLAPVINLDSWESCVDVCNETITKKDASQAPRYEMNAIILSDDETRDSLEQIQLAMAGHISNASGEWYFEAGKWKGEELEYQVGEILEEVEISLQVRASEVPTHVKGSITSKDHHWSEVEYPAQDIGEAGEVRVDLELPMEMVTSHEQAQRIARIEGNRARQEMGAIVTLGPRGILSRPGTVGRYTLPMMESAGSHLYEMTDFDRQMGVDEEEEVFYRAVHTIRSTSESDFAWDAATMEKELPLGSNNLSSNGICRPSFVRFTRTDTVTIPAVPDDPETPEDESVAEVPGNTELVITWDSPSCADKDILFVRIKGVINGVEKTEDIPTGTDTATLTWTPESFDPATVSAQAFFDDGTNTGETLGSPA